MENMMKQYENYMIITKGKSTNTVRGYMTDLKQFVKYIGNPIEANRASIIDYITSLHPRYAPSSIERKVASIQSLWAFMIDYGYVKEDITRKLPVPQKKKSIIECPDTEEIEKIIIREEEPSLKIAIELGAYVGLRVSEVCNLKMEQIDFDKSTLTLYDTKTHDSVYVMIDSVTLKHIKEYTKENGIFSGYVLRTRLGRPWKTRNLHKNLEGKFDFTFHKFRHACCTKLANEVGLNYAFQQLRHSSITTTQRYLHLDKKAQLTALDEIRGKK